MKPLYKSVICLVIGIAVGAAAVFGIFVLPESAEKAPETVESDNVPPCNEYIDLAYRIAGYLKSSDYKSLAKVVHPQYGVIFTPYSTVDVLTNRSFTPSQVADFDRDAAVYVWGTENVTGQPIEMTPADYVARFVYDRDYCGCTAVSVDTVAKTGNSLENIYNVFPESHFVDFLYAQSPESASSDWSILRLVFEEYDGEYMLTAIIHSENTI